MNRGLQTENPCPSGEKRTVQLEFKSTFKILKEEKLCNEILWSKRVLNVFISA